MKRNVGFSLWRVLLSRFGRQSERASRPSVVGLKRFFDEFPIFDDAKKTKRGSFRVVRVVRLRRNALSTKAHKLMTATNIALKELTFFFLFFFCNQSLLVCISLDKPW